MDKADFIKWVSKLAETYQPSDAVRSKLAGVTLLAIVGPTGVGKTTILDALDLPTVKSDVTRNMRPDEKNHDNYNFRDDYLGVLKQVKDGDFAQFLVSDSGEFYGTIASAYPGQGSCTMAVFADALDDFRKLGFKKVVPIYIMPPGYIEWMRRIGTIRTGDLGIRIKEAKRSIELAVADQSYHFILNDNVELAIKDIQAVVSGSERDEHRAQLARATADVLLEKIGDKNDDMYFSN